VKRKARVVVAAIQSPFVEGGAERHVDRLVEELEGSGVEAEKVTMPLFERSRFDLVKSALMWRLGDFSQMGGRPVDALIATRFPSYLALHPRKVVWLIHQYRQVYDQYGTAYSNFTATAEDRRIRDLIRRMDDTGLGEARRVFANSDNVARRLKRYNGIESRALYHPPPLAGRYRGGPPGDFALWVGRLEAWKRPELALGALAHAPSARLRIVGEGPEAASLERRAHALGVEDRLEMLGRVPDERLLELYAESRLVVVTAADEDYGYVALEGFLSGKAVLTVSDAGGPLEFVRDGRTGIVVAPVPEALGAALEICWNRTDELERMARRGRREVEKIRWNAVIEELLAAAGL
jgi:glycosyltransferase involved in cell wall biosynthesis